MANVIISEEEYNELKKSHDSWRDRYYEVRYALRKDEQLDESISSTDIPSDVEVIEDLKKRAADSDLYKEMSELLKVKLKNANEVADSWKRDYERIREQILCPIYNILYPDNPNLDINVTDLLNTIKDFKVYADENESMYADLKYWKERCHKAETDVTILNSKVETLKNKNDKSQSEIENLTKAVGELQSDIATLNSKIKVLDKRNTNQSVIIGEKGKQIEELTRRYNMIAKKLNDIHDILKEDPNNA
jgi:chromosome segregation ATPase